MEKSADSSAAQTHRKFFPAKPSPWLLFFAQTVLRADLFWNNRVHIRAEDLDRLKGLPQNSGMILTPNHADEEDPKICLDLSRRCGRRFIFMGNREAFDECNGVAGWVLQRLGLFSVERGARDAPAKRYAIDVVKAHKNVMVIFPEGEIFYLNESVQPFHSGAIDIGMRAIVESRNVQPDWTAYIIPMAIKYTYNQPMQRILDQRVRRMEVRLAQHAIERELHKRIDNLLTDVVKNEESKHNIQQSDSERMKALSDRLKSARHAILASIEQKHTAMYNAQSRTIDRAWQLGAHLRQKMESRKFSHTQQLQIRNDIQDLREVAELTSFRPEYWESSSSTDRLAEVILKLEREIFQIKRPHQLARRDVYIRIGEPIDLGQFLAAYQEDPHSLRHKLAEQLRTTVQLHIDEVAQKV